MSINESIVGTNVSSSTVPTALTSDVIIEGNGKGKVSLECQIPSGVWVGVTYSNGAFVVATPDPAINYRFRSVKVVNAVNVYFGP